MSQTPDGAKQAAQTNLDNDPDYYKRIGRLGGQRGTTGGFGQGEAGRERAKIYGRIGGRISKRPKMKGKANEQENTV